MHLITGFAGENHVTSANDGMRNSLIFGDRYIFDVQNKFEAVKINNNTIRIYDGYGIIDGRMFEIPKGEYEDVTIDNGQEGVNRVDLIVARYEKNEDDGTEGISLVVLKGNPNSGYPTVSDGNIYNGDLIAEMPLYVVRINGTELHDFYLYSDKLIYNKYSNDVWKYASRGPDGTVDVPLFNEIEIGVGAGTLSSNGIDFHTRISRAMIEKYNIRAVPTIPIERFSIGDGGKINGMRAEIKVDLYDSGAGKVSLYMAKRVTNSVESNISDACLYVLYR